MLSIEVVELKSFVDNRTRWIHNQLQKDKLMIKINAFRGLYLEIGGRCSHSEKSRNVGTAHTTINNNYIYNMCIYHMMSDTDIYTLDIYIYTLDIYIPSVGMSV